MKTGALLGAICAGLLLLVQASAEEKSAKAVLADYFPPAESKGGWRSLLPGSLPSSLSLSNRPNARLVYAFELL